MATMKLTDERIYSRIQGVDTAMTQWRQKNHRLRRLVAGDITALQPQNTNALTSSDEHEMAKLYREDSELYDILIQDVEEARTNMLLQTVRTFSMQVSHVFPDIEFENLSADEAAVNSLYCKKRLGGPPHGCMARHEMRMATHMYLIDGLGAVFIGMRNEQPIIEYLDVLDMVWDMSARVWGEVRWCAYKQRNPLYVWRELFHNKPKALAALKEQDPSGEAQDKPLTLWLYYDLDGNYCVFFNGEAESSQLILREKNPYTIPRGGQEIYMLPVEFMYLLALPSVKMPESLIQQMLPNQIGLWTAHRTMRDNIETGKAIHEYEADAHDVKDLQRYWESDEPGQWLKRKKDGQWGVNIVPPVPIDPEIPKYIEYQEKGMIGVAGINPYMSGNKVEGVSYAAEVNAIQGNSGLTAAAIAKDTAEFWARVVRKFLAVGRLYDDQPITLTMSGDQTIELVFDETDPIKDYLEPDTEIVVREDAMQFQAKEQKLAMAQALLQQAIGMAMFAPNAPMKAFENLLRAAGEKNISEWLKPPEIPGPMGAGQIDPAMQAGMSTQQTA